MIDFFVFPFKFTDLLDDSADTRYRVSSPDGIAKMDERHILRTLNEIEKAVFDDFTMIKDSDRFDFLFFWIKHLEDKKENYPIETIETTADLLISSLERIFKFIQDEQNNNSMVHHAAVDELRVCFKMNLFLMFYFLRNTRMKKSKNSLKDEINEAAIQSSKHDKKKNRSTRNKKDMSSESLESLLKKQKKCLICLEETLDVDFKFLWNKRSIDGELFKYYVETCLTMLESKVLLRDSDVKSTIFGILEFVLAEFPEALKNVQIKFINLIYDDENIVEPIADFIIKGYKSEKGNMAKLATDTLMMLVNYVVERTNVNNESQAVKNTKEFLCKVSESIPKMFYNNLSSFIVLYDSEAYLLRNSLNEIIANIIKKVLTRSEEDEDDLNNQENHIVMKKKLLDKLIVRVYDKHAFCRSHILSILSGLCEGNTIPREYLFDVFKKACDRIKDVSAHVRKKAIQLLIITMQYYYVIYVESQKQSESRKFLSLEKVEKDLAINKMQEEDIITGMTEIEESIRQIKDPLKPDLQEFQADLKALKKKNEMCATMRKCLQEYKEVLLGVKEIAPNLEMLLGSKNVGDVLETIKLLTFLHKTNIESCRAGVKKMLVLIWSKDKIVKEEVLKAYWQFVFEPKEFEPNVIANNLITLINESTMTEATSLEELLNFLLDWNNQIEEKEKDKKKDLYLIPPLVYKKLWEVFMAGQREGQQLKTKEETRAALQLLRICCARNKEAWAHKFETFLGILASYRRNKHRIDWIIVKEISMIVEKTNDPPAKLLQTFLSLLIENQGVTDTEWFCAAEQVINMLFSFNKDPEELAKNLILKCTRFLYEGKKKDGIEDTPSFNVPATPQKMTQSQAMESQEENKMTIEEEAGKSKELDFEMKLAQLLFVVGHVALKYLIYIDNYENELKKMKNEAETKYQANQKDNNNEDLEKIHGGLEAEYEKKIEMLHQISEKDLLGKNLLGCYIPFIKKICKDILDGLRVNVNPILDRAVLMTLCKFMCVSGNFCKENLDVVFKLMNSNVDPTIKNNIIISLGDIMHRYPNIIEPFTNNIYQNLRDKEASVRKTTLLVITHLILNDMLKLKGEICDVALLLEDKDAKIQNLVKLLFHELHKKNPQIIYNLLPEAIGRMSKIYEGDNEKDAFLQVEESSFQNFAKNVMPYLEKDKYSESLVEKLCMRFKNSKNEKEWRNTAFCLSLLAFNDRAVRKLLELYENYRSKLSDPQIMESFHNIVSKLKKNMRNEMKNLVEELESKVNSYCEDGMEEKRKQPDRSKKNKKARGDEMVLEDQTSENKENVSNAPSLSQQKARTKHSKKSSHHHHHTGKKRIEEEEEGDGDMDIEIVESKRNERPKRNTTVAKKQYMEIEDDDEGDADVIAEDDDE